MSEDLVFAAITKIDVEKREVTGIIAEERRDKTGEKFDYAASKPHFQSWSAGIKKGSGGRSLGNVRRMHQPHVSGVVKELSFLDGQKVIPVRARVIDNDDWAKCLEGGYTGFSIGGKYAKKWADPEEPGVTRYEAVPSEISLVDNPCMYGATFQVVKGADLVREQAFTVKPAEGGDMGKAERTDDVTAADKARAAKEYGDVEYADPENKKYPLSDEKMIRAAWSYANMPKNAAKYTDRGTAVKRRIVAAWKRKIDEAGPPSAGKVAKGFYEVGDLADLRGQLETLLDRLAVEQAQEDENSQAVTALEAAARGLGDALVALTREENEEFATDTDAPGPGGGPLMLQAAATGDLAKVGARNAAADLKRINSIHSMAVELGATCGPSMSKREETTVTEQELEKAVLGAVAKNNDALAKSVTDLVNKVASETVEKALGAAVGAEVAKAIAPLKDALEKGATEAKGALEKLAADTKGELEKAATEAKAQTEAVAKTVGELTERLAKVEATPAAPTGVKAVPALGKGKDTGAGDDPAFDMSKATPQEMIKHLHSHAGKIYQPGIAA